MYVCLCHAVNECRVRELVHGGETSVKGLRLKTGLGSTCGKCVPQARQVLQSSMPAPGATVIRGQTQAA